MNTTNTKLSSTLKCLALGGVLVFSGNASALTINSTFISGGNSFSGGLGVAGAAGASVGGGTLTSIFEAAEDWWEAAIHDTHTVSIEYGWQGLGGGTLGVHALISQGGAPNRETAAVIRFDNDGSSGAWFADATPKGNSEYTTFTQTSQDFGGGNLNKGRVYTGATGDATGRYDLFSVVLHEIGHSLGLSGANIAFQAENVDRDIDVTGPRPFSGSALPTEPSGTAHLNIGTSLMWPFSSPGQRVMLSSADILANCQISQFTDCNLDPSLVPEPDTLPLLAMGWMAWRLNARRSRLGAREA